MAEGWLSAYSSMSIRIGIEGGERIKSLLRLGDVGLNDCTAWPLGHDWTSARCLVSVGRMKAATNPSSEKLVYCRWTGCRHPSWRSLWLPLVVRGGGPRNGLRGGPHGGCPRRLPVVVPHGNPPWRSPRGDPLVVPHGGPHGRPGGIPVAVVAVPVDVRCGSCQLMPSCHPCCCDGGLPRHYCYGHPPRCPTPHYLGLNPQVRWGAGTTPLQTPSPCRRVQVPESQG